MTVEHPGQQRGAGGVDDLVAVEPGADRDDAIALDSDVGRGSTFRVVLPAGRRK